MDTNTDIDRDPQPPVFGRVNAARVAWLNLKVLYDRADFPLVAFDTRRAHGPERRGSTATNRPMPVRGTRS